jgi:DNA-binding NarL/FixJ family response regulator
MTRLFLVSPAPAVRAGLRVLLGGEERVDVVGEGATLDALGDYDGALDAVLIDATPELEVSDLATVAPASVILLGPVADDRALATAMAGQAWAYIPRDASGEQLVAAVRAVEHGMVVVDAGLAGRVLLAENEGGSVGRGASDGELTPRERETLDLVALGLPNKTIAQRLGISDHTAKFHVAAVMAKLGAASRTEAVRLAARRGLLTL